MPVSIAEDRTASPAAGERATELSPLARLQGLVAGQLYPQSTAAGWQEGRLAGLLVFVVASVVALFRLPVHSLDTIWAEDGTQFLQQALNSSTAGAITTPYAGYLHLYPRLTAEVASALPLSAAGVVFSVAAALVVGLAAWSVWILSAGHLPSRWLRGLLAAAVVLIPAGGLEAVDNVANSHFYLMFAAFWALLARRDGAGRQVLPALIVIFSALSDPVSLLLLPLALGRLLTLRRWSDRAVPLCYLIALGVQLAVVFTAQRSTGASPSLRDIAFGYALRVVSTSVLGMHWTDRLVAAAGSRGVWALAAVVALYLALAITVTRRRLVVAAAGIASLAFFVVASAFALGVQYPPSGAASTNLLYASRYTVVPALLLVTAGMLAAQGFAERLPRRALPVNALVVMLPVLLIGYYDYLPPTPTRVGMPAGWSQEVHRAEHRCLQAGPRQIEVLTISPTPVWKVRIPCTTLRENG